VIDLDAPPHDLRAKLEASSHSELKALCSAYDLYPHREKSYLVAQCIQYVSGQMEFTPEALEILLGPFASRAPSAEGLLRRTLKVAYEDEFYGSDETIFDAERCCRVLDQSSGFGYLNAPKLSMDSPIKDWNVVLNESFIRRVSFFQDDNSFSELEQSYVKASRKFSNDLKVAVSMIMILGIVSAISLLLPSSEEFQQGVLGLICVGLLFSVGGAFVGADSVGSILVRDFRSSREAREELARLRSQIEQSPQFDVLHVNPMEELLDFTGCGTIEQYLSEVDDRWTKWHRPYPSKDANPLFGTCRNHTGGGM